MINTKELLDLDLFCDLNQSEAEEVSSILSFMQVHEGEVLSQKGQPAHTFYLIISGDYMVHFDNGRAFTIHEKGQIIGWSAVVTPFRYRGTSIALTNGEVIAMKGRELLKLIQGNSNLGDKIMAKVNEGVAKRMSFIQGTNE